MLSLEKFALFLLLVFIFYCDKEMHLKSQKWLSDHLLASYGLDQRVFFLFVWFTSDNG